MAVIRQHRIHSTHLHHEQIISIVLHFMGIISGSGPRAERELPLELWKFAEPRYDFMAECSVKVEQIFAFQCVTA